LPGPFEQHLRDAIALNRHRAPHYSSRSGGRSRSISRALIAAEWALLPVARWFDRRAEPYHRAGIPLLDEVFTSMEEVPPLGSCSPRLTSATYRPPEVAAIRRRVRSEFVAAGFGAAERAISVELSRLDRDSHLDCTLRHLLESAHRIAALAPQHIARARSAGLASPESLIARLLRLHLRGLPLAAWLDARARPVQMAGIPILEQDLPRIAL
jgi:hypothetical protein